MRRDLMAAVVLAGVLVVAACTGPAPEPCRRAARRHRRHRLRRVGRRRLMTTSWSWRRCTGMCR